jgi:hypothetical protein
MHQQLWGYKVEWKSVSRGTVGKKVEYHWSRVLTLHQPSRSIATALLHNQQRELTGFPLANSYSGLQNCVMRGLNENLDYMNLD